MVCEGPHCLQRMSVRAFDAPAYSLFSLAPSQQYVRGQQDDMSTALHDIMEKLHHETFDHEVRRIPVEHSSQAHSKGIPSVEDCDDSPEGIV